MRSDGSLKNLCAASDIVTAEAADGMHILASVLTVGLLPGLARPPTRSAVRAPSPYLLAYTAPPPEIPAPAPSPFGLLTDPANVHPIPTTPEGWLRAAREARGDWRAVASIARASLREAPPPAARFSTRERLPVKSLFTNAIEACANASEWRAGIELLRELEGSGREAGAAAYIAALHGCTQGGEWAAAVALLQRARARPQWECTPGMYSAAIAACEAAGKPDEADELYAHAVDDGAFSHWHASEPFSLDLHGFTPGTAACAVRHVLTRELGNYLPSDLKIITGRGRGSPDGLGKLGPRIERLLSAELSPAVAYEKAERLHCDEQNGERQCTVIENDGCLVVRVQELFRYLVDAKPFESYCIKLPATSMQ